MSALLFKLLFLSLCPEHEKVIHNSTSAEIAQVQTDLSETQLYNSAIKQRPFNIQEISIKDLSGTFLEITSDFRGVKVKVCYVEVI